MSRILPSDDDFQDRLVLRFLRVRQFSKEICRHLEPEDYIIQAMPHTSPPKWHLAHTSWFYEHFLLREFKENFEEYSPQFGLLFNSYYETVGSFHPRHARGVLARPSNAEVSSYRDYIDEQVCELAQKLNDSNRARFLKILEIGTHHEQQHQELLFMDIKYNFSCNPIAPIYRSSVKEQEQPRDHSKLEWISLAEGTYQIGADDQGFSYDNEKSRHRVFIEECQLANRLVTNQEFLEFIQDGGYHRVELWLSEGWDHIQKNQSRHPLYWQKKDDCWQEFTLSGMKTLDPHTPVSHVNYFEADAYARWRGARLPTEFEWEAFAADLPVEGNFAATTQSSLQPVAIDPEQLKTDKLQLYGDCWEWTSSSYAPYPRFKAEDGSLGEYNGKFMCNQYVLRGGSCLSPEDHIRKTYRNYFNPDAQWNCSGIRLAKD